MAKPKVPPELVQKFQNASVLDGESNISKAGFAGIAELIFLTDAVTFIRLGPHQSNLYVMSPYLADKLYPNPEMKQMAPVSDCGPEAIRLTTSGGQMLEILRKRMPYVTVVSEEMVQKAVGVSKYVPPRSVPDIDIVDAPAPVKMALYGQFHAATLVGRGFELRQWPNGDIETVTKGPQAEPSLIKI